MMHADDDVALDVQDSMCQMIIPGWQHTTVTTGIQKDEQCWPGDGRQQHATLSTAMKMHLFILARGQHTALIQNLTCVGP